MFRKGLSRCVKSKTIFFIVNGVSLPSFFPLSMTVCQLGLELMASFSLPGDPLSLTNLLHTHFPPDRNTATEKTVFPCFFMLRSRHHRKANLSTIPLWPFLFFALSYITICMWYLLYVWCLLTECSLCCRASRTGSDSSVESESESPPASQLASRCLRARSSTSSSLTLSNSASVAS